MTIHISTDKTDYRIPESPCPVCGTMFNAGQKLACELMDDEDPEEFDKNTWKGPFPGAWGVCKDCGEVLMYDETYTLIIPPDEAWRRLSPEQFDMILQFQEQIRNKNHN